VVVAIRDCLISGNADVTRAAIRCAEGSSPMFRNCTVSGNTSLMGAAVLFANSTGTFVDSIIWENAGG
jgi:hypothetical protein